MKIYYLILCAREYSCWYEKENEGKDQQEHNSLQDNFANAAQSPDSVTRGWHGLGFQLVHLNKLISFYIWKILAEKMFKMNRLVEFYQKVVTASFTDKNLFYFTHCLFITLKVGELPFNGLQ